MKKKELQSVEIQLANSENIAFAKRVTAAAHFTLAEEQEIKGIHTLIINFYSREKLVQGNIFPLFRVFFQNDDYITQCIDQTPVWRKGRIWALLWGLYGWENTTVSFNEATEKLLCSYFKDYQTNNKGKISVYYAISNFQEQVLKKRKLMRHQKETDKIDAKMEEISELPKDFLKWCDETALYQSRYIYYKKRNGLKPVAGFCTCCQTDVMVSEPRHNHDGTCPNCSKKIQFKVIGRTKRIFDRQAVALLQKVNQGFAVRYFNVYKDYKDYRNPIITYKEEIRTFYSDNKKTYFIWGNFKQTGNYRWCNDTRFYYLTNTMLYPHNVNESIQETKWKYCALKEYAEQKEIKCIPAYFTKYEEYPFIEKFIKAGLFRLADDLLNGHCAYDLYSNAATLTKVLGVNRNELKQLCKMNISTGEFEIFQKGKVFNICLSAEEICQLKNDFGYDAPDVVSHLKYTTLHKLNQYLKSKSIERGSDLQTTWILWRDMIEMSIKLKIDLKNSFNLFPKNLVQTHDFVTKCLNEIRNKEAKKEKQRLAKKAKVLFEKLRPQYEWENETYAVLVPKNEKDFRKEGSALHICVGINGYYENMVNGNTIVLFLRRKAEIDKPFYTIELKNNSIVQCHSFGHRGPTADINIVLEQYLKEKLKKVEKNKIA